MSALPSGIRCRYLRIWLKHRQNLSMKEEVMPNFCYLIVLTVFIYVFARFKVLVLQRVHQVVEGGVAALEEGQGEEVCNWEILIR